MSMAPAFLLVTLFVVAFAYLAHRRAEVTVYHRVLSPWPFCPAPSVARKKQCQLARLLRASVRRVD